MSFNVNYGLAGDPATVAAIGSSDCDVVFLQETTPAWEQALRGAFGGRFPHRLFKHGGGAGGQAILSRFPLLDCGLLAPPPGGWFPGWRTVIDTPLGPVQALSVHLRPPLSDSGSVVSGYFVTPEIREAEIDLYARALDPALPTVVLGDFNEDDGDAVARLVEAGFHDVVPAFDPDATTWRWQTSVGELTLGLDHVLHDARLEALDAEVVQAGRSDHLPVVVSLTKRR